MKSNRELRTHIEGLETRIAILEQRIKYIEISLYCVASSNVN